MRPSLRLAASAIVAACSTASADPVRAIVVAPRDGDFATVQAAVDSVSATDPTPRTIVIRPGTYKQFVQIPKGQSHLTLRGDGPSPAQTVLTDDRSAKSVDPKTNTEVGTRGSASTVIEGNDITCENLTFQNTAGDVGQAVALRTAGDRLVCETAAFSAGRTRCTPMADEIFTTAASSPAGSISSSAAASRCSIIAKSKAGMAAT